jgi:hypothetical protein
MEQYRSVATFEAVGTGELCVVEGEIVTVIEKNTSGKLKNIRKTDTSFLHHAEFNHKCCLVFKSTSSC